MQRIAFKGLSSHSTTSKQEVAYSLMYRLGFPVALQEHGHMRVMQHDDLFYGGTCVAQPATHRYRVPAP